ncbi:hypothetical protein Tco_0133901 [Tanacetum coccineum]
MLRLSETSRCCQVATRPRLGLCSKTWISRYQRIQKAPLVAVKHISKAIAIQMITKSQTGYVFIVNGGAVDWKSKKQTTIAMHATQSEYMVASEAAMEAV